ncbi:MAG: ABC-2 family transporter protein [Bdellovibrionaceae bacterium]|nr:ABC-2 family transporter protein [Pseudobdellovibrionaceae bacterium]
MEKMKKYIGLLVAFSKASFISDMEYRLNFVNRIAMDVVWYAVQIFAFEVLFRHTTHLGGWTVEQVRVFLGVLFAVDAIYMYVFSENLDHFVELVRKGDLDLLLAKPVSAQFMVSFRKFHSASLVNFTMAVAWLWWSLSFIPDFNPWRLLWLLVIFPCGLAVIYTIRFFFCSLALIFTRSDNLQFVWYHLWKLGQRPDSIYVPWFRYFLLSALPVGIIGSVPARLLMEQESLWLVPWSLGISFLMLGFSRRFWHFCLRQYSSASS